MMTDSPPRPEPERVWLSESELKEQLELLMETVERMKVVASSDTTPAIWQDAIKNWVSELLNVYDELQCTLTALDRKRYPEKYRQYEDLIGQLRPGGSDANKDVIAKIRAVAEKWPT